MALNKYKLPSHFKVADVADFHQATESALARGMELARVTLAADEAREAGDAKTAEAKQDFANYIARTMIEDHGPWIEGSGTEGS